MPSKTRFSKFMSEWQERPPIYYCLQLYTQMMAMDSYVGYIGCAALTEDNIEFIVYNMARSPELDECIHSEVKRFEKEIITDKGQTFKINSEIKKRVLDIQ